MQRLVLNLSLSNLVGWPVTKTLQTDVLLVIPLQVQALLQLGSEDLNKPDKTLQQHIDFSTLVIREKYSMWQHNYKTTCKVCFAPLDWAEMVYCYLFKSEDVFLWQTKGWYVTERDLREFSFFIMDDDKHTCWKILSVAQDG